MNERIIRLRSNPTESIKEFIVYNLAETFMFDGYDEETFETLVNIGYQAWLTSKTDITFERIAQAMAFIQEQENPEFSPQIVLNVIAQYFWD